MAAWNFPHENTFKRHVPDFDAKGESMILIPCDTLNQKDHNHCTSQLGRPQDSHQSNERRRDEISRASHRSADTLSIIAIMLFVPAISIQVGALIGADCPVWQVPDDTPLPSEWPP